MDYDVILMVRHKVLRASQEVDTKAKAFSKFMSRLCVNQKLICLPSRTKD